MLFLVWLPIFVQLVCASSKNCTCNEGICEETQNEAWSYGGRNGPQQWPAIYPTCNGSNQSPIDINTTAAAKNCSMRLEINYKRPLREAKLENDGHTAKLTPQDGVYRTAYGDLTQFHFHWGCNGTQGSEHRINGKSYAMEMHFVHVRQSDGKITVLAVFFKECGHHKSTDGSKCLAPILKVLDDIEFKGQSTVVEFMDLRQCVSNSEFCTYEGSLTTPPCSEGVTWLVLRKPLCVSRRQLDRFRNLQFTETKQDNCSMVNNFRPVQPLGDRIVTCSCKETKH